MNHSFRNLIRVSLLLLMMLFTVNHSNAQQTLFWTEPHCIDSITVFHGNLYLLTDEGLFQYEEETESPVLVTDKVSADIKKANYVASIISNVYGLYAIQPENKMLLQLLDGEGQMVISRISEIPLKETDNMLAASATNQYVSFLMTNGYETYIDSYTFDMQKHLYYAAPGITAIHGGDDDFLYFSSVEGTREGMRYQIQKLNIVSSNAIEVFECGDRFDSLCIDEEGFLYVAGEGYLYFANPETNDLENPVHIAEGDVGECEIFSSGMAGVIVDNSLSIRNISEKSNLSSLVILNINGRTEGYYSYIMNHPDKELILIRNNNLSPEEQFVLDMETHSGEVDIYKLNDLSIIGHIVNKGMAYDMSKVAELKQYFEDFFPAFAHIFGSGSSLWAAPAEVYISVPAYNKLFFEDYLLPVPETMNELFDLTEYWMENYATLHPEISFDPFSNGVNIELILNSFEAECLLKDGVINFENDELADILDRYRKIWNKYSSTAFASNTTISAFSMQDLPHSPIYSPLLLSIQSDATPSIGVSSLECSFYVINPYGVHQEDACEFVLEMLDGMDDLMKAGLFRSYCHALESHDYDSNSKRIKEKMETIQEVMNNSDDGVSDEIIAMWEQLENDLEIENLNQWIITEEEATSYQTVVEKMSFPVNDPLSEIESIIMPYTEAWINDKLTTQEYLRTINQKIQMVLLEN